MHYKIGHDTACIWGNKILNSHMVEIVKVSDEHINFAWELFQKFHDQKFSFTDCLSFTVMKLLGISPAFAYDSHFSTMGFCITDEEDSLKKIVDTGTKKSRKRKV